MVDLIILLVAAACQVALAWIGVHVSAHTPSRRDKETLRRIRLSFFGIATLGVLAIVVGGYPAANKQDDIAEGVHTIQIALGITKPKGRAAIKQQLGTLYAEGIRLANDGPPSREPEQYKKYQAALTDWRERVVRWLTENMTPAAAAKFWDYQDQFKSMGFQGANIQETWDRDFTFALARNLDLMIQHDTWDKPQ